VRQLVRHSSLLSGGEGNLVLVPTTTVVRLASEAPPLGRRYAFANGGRTFMGVVAKVAVFGDKHVTLTIELTGAEHRRLIDEG
jgi:hypothetical protein